MMRHLTKSERAKLWLDRFHRFAAGTQPITAFCAAQGHSPAAFYQWKRRLAPAVRPPESTSKSSRARSHPKLEGVRPEKSKPLTDTPND